MPLEDRQEVIKSGLRFAAYFPERYDVSNISLRIEDRRWPTLRYDFSGAASGRVKQFFMDWFYYGFPKSLMSSLVDGYSHIDSRLGKNLVFIGKDYKMKEAACSTVLGTQIEVEFESCSAEKKLDFMDSLATTEDELKRVLPLRYHERGFHTLGNMGDWFEDQRIARLDWKALDDSFDTDIGFFQGSSVGTLTESGKTKQVYRVYQSGGFESSVSIDLWKKDVRTDHVKYNLRKGGNFFEVQRKVPSLALYKENYGPAFLWFDSTGIEGIIALYGRMSEEEAEKLHSACIERIDSDFLF